MKRTHREIIVSYSPYGGYSFEDKNGYLIKNIQEVFVENVQGLKGKLKCTGSSPIIEHGYSGIEEYWYFIDQDINMHRLRDGDKFTTNELIENYPKQEKLAIEKDILLGCEIEVIDGMNATFYYDKK